MATLYDREVLRLAAELAATPALVEADASVERVSRLCGSRMRVDVRLDDRGRIAALGMTARACALGQASAALLARAATGTDLGELQAARARVAEYLAGGEEPSWPGYATLAGARAATARHAAILLPFDAAIAALQAALSSSRNAATSASGTSVATNA